MTASDLKGLLRRYWLLCAAVFAVVVASGVAAIVLPAERYKSRVILSVVPADKSSFDFGGTQIVQYLIPPVLTRVQSEVFERGVRQQLPSDLQTAPVELTAENDPGTGIVRVDALSSTRRAAHEAARLAAQAIGVTPGSQLIRISTLTPPAPAESVRADRAPPILAGSILLGLILAVLTGVAAHRLRPPLPRAEGFRQRYGYEVLGEIPPARDMPYSPAAGFAPSGPVEVAAAFRNLEARLMLRLPASDSSWQRPTIAVTSWGEGEGKSTVVANLAWALASLEHPVTLVDFDLRRPRLHEIFDVELDRGVADLARGADVRVVRRATGLSSLRVIPAGRSNGYFTETVHLALPRLAGLANEIVLLDTPPMFTAETVEIIGAADAILLVADSRERTADEIEEALSEIFMAGTPVLGVVMNRVQRPDSRDRTNYYYAEHAAQRRAAS